jgi:hypothetical protein
MKTIYIRYHDQLLRMIIAFLVIVIVFTISSQIFADINYYKAWFTDYLKHSSHRTQNLIIQEELIDS